MKLAIIADPLDNQNAGVHVYTREMVNSLIRHNPGWEIILIRQKRDEGLKGVRQIVVKSTNLPIGYASLRLFFIIPLILKKEKPDAVIEPAHFGPFNLPNSIKRITIIHDLTPLILPQYHRFHSQLLQRIFLRRILQKADLIVCNSDFTRADIHRYFPFTDGKTQRIYPGPGIRSKSESDLIRPFFLDASPYFLTVGTIEPRKNHLLLLEAFRHFKISDTDNVQLLICSGTGWKSSTFFKALENHPFKSDIHLSGFVTDDQLLGLYHRAVAMVYPSTYEGFGLPVVESVNAGTIPIISNNSSLPEVGGPDACYVNEKNPVKLAKLMLEVYKLSPEKRAFKIRKLQQHADQFSWESFGKQLWHAVIKLKNSK